MVGTPEKPSTNCQRLRSFVELIFLVFSLPPKIYAVNFRVYTKAEMRVASYIWYIFDKGDEEAMNSLHTNLYVCACVCTCIYVCVCGYVVVHDAIRATLNHEALQFRRLLKRVLRKFLFYQFN